MEINKILVLVNLDIDKKGELRQVVLTEDESNFLKTLFIKGAICKQIKVLSESIESIILEGK